MTEEWKPVDGYEGYEVSNFGRVRSLDRYVKTPLPKGVMFKHGRVIATFSDKNGYEQMIFRREGKKCRAKVHRLVAIAFIPNPRSLATVNHKDGDKRNNHVDNLEWASQGENNLHARRVLGLVVGEKHHRAKLTSVQVQEIRQLVKTGSLNHRQIGEMYGVTSSMISCIARGKSWQCLPDKGLASTNEMNPSPSTARV